MEQSNQDKLRELINHYYDDEFNRTREKEWRFEKILLELRAKNLSGLRSYWMNLIIISGAVIVGIITTIISGGNLFHAHDVLYFGLFLLSAIPLIGAFYLNRNLTRENNNLSKLAKFQKGTTTAFKEKLLENHGKGMHPIQCNKELLKFSKDKSEEERKLRKSFEEKNIILRYLDKYFSDIISYLFIAGIIAILISLIDG